MDLYRVGQAQYLDYDHWKERPPLSVECVVDMKLSSRMR